MGFGQFRDYYVDALASGTGDGSSPTNASTFLANNSVFTIDAGSSMVRAWVRRTHVETIPLNANIGAANALWNTNRRQFIIGWPSSGDPFYDERPAAGVSAGWDADNSARAIKTTYGLNFPTLTSSAGGMRFRDGTHVFNMNFDYVNSSNIGNIPVNIGDASYYHNVVFTNRDGPTGGLILTGAGCRWGRLWVINTPSRPAFTQINSFVADQIVIHSLSMVASGVIQGGGQPYNHYIGEIVNYSNSVDYLFGAADRSYAHGVGHAAVNYLGRATGIKPYSGWNGFTGPFKQNGTFTAFSRCDDYFGEGPVFAHGALGPHMRLASSGEAMYHDARAVFVECQSWGADWGQYGRNTQIMQPVKKFFDVVSGSPVTIFQPVYVSSTAVFSLANGTAIAWLRAKDCMPQIITGSHMLVGSLARWSGSKLGGGVAWTIATTFTPTETARVIYECAIPVLVQSTDQGNGAYMIYGEPWIAA